MKWRHLLLPLVNKYVLMEVLTYLQSTPLTDIYTMVLHRTVPWYFFLGYIL